MPYACKTHKAERPLLLKREDRARYDAKRPSAGERGYGYAWRKARAQFRATHPLCEDCFADGKYVMGEQVHHTKKAVDFPELFWDDGYWMSLCARHHSIRTAKGE